MSTTIPELSVVVPVYNEESALPAFMDRLVESLKLTKLSWEIVLVDDGSKDGTYPLIEQISRSRCEGRFVGLKFSRNFGKEAALLAGLEHATGKAVIIMDGDGQHPPELITALIEPWRDARADIVLAVKQHRTADSILARANAAVFNALMKWATGMEMPGASDFQLLDRRVVASLLQMKERNRFFRGLSLWTGFRVEKIPFAVEERIGGESKWNAWGLIKLAVTGITSFSARPLTLVMGLGLFGIAVSFILLVQALWSWFSGVAVSGWTSLTIVILFFGSANLIAVGLVGIYLAKVYEEVKARPSYFIQKRTGSKERDQSVIDH